MGLPNTNRNASTTQTHTCSCVRIWSKNSDNIYRTYTYRCHADKLLDNPYIQPHSLSLIHGFNAITYLNMCKVYSRFVSCCDCVPTKTFEYNYMHPTSTRTHKHTTIRTNEKCNSILYAAQECDLVARLSLSFGKCFFCDCETFLPLPLSPSSPPLFLFLFILSFLHSFFFLSPVSLSRSLLLLCTPQMCRVCVVIG